MAWRKQQELGVHPVADLFPMLNDDDLAEMAADIKQRGLLQPIVLDGEGRILDGRNRHAACKAAGVDPVFVTYDGDDPDGYALAVNIGRRNLTRGARIGIAALAARLEGRGGQAKYTNSYITQPRLAEAYVVIEYSANGDLINALIAGEPLSVVLKTARERKQAAKIRDQKLTRLRTEAPDLAELVEESRTGVDEAIDSLEGRIRRAAEQAAAEAEQARREAAAEEERQRREASEATRRAIEERRANQVHINSVSGNFRLAVRNLVMGFGSPELRDELKWYDPSAGDAPPFPIDIGVLDKLVEIAPLIRDTWKELQ